MVPEQLTLDTERGLLEGAEPDRFLPADGAFSRSACATGIFDEAGRPERVRIDDRGRALLMGHVLRSLKKQLKVLPGRAIAAALRCASWRK